MAREKGIEDKPYSMEISCSLEDYRVVLYEIVNTFNICSIVNGFVLKEYWNKILLKLLVKRREY